MPQPFNVVSVDIAFDSLCLGVGLELLQKAPVGIDLSILENYLVSASENHSDNLGKAVLILL